MVTEQSFNPHLDIVTYNKNALNNLRRAIVLGEGQFSLILARVNYRHLRQVLLDDLSEQLPLTIVSIAPTATRLRDAILEATSASSAASTAPLGASAIAPPTNPSQALMVFGLEDIRSPSQLKHLLVAANLGRDELPKTFNTPVVLWVNDATLQQLNRYAPDLKSFAATPIRFEYPVPALIEVLTAQANETFSQILDTDNDLLLGTAFPAAAQRPLTNFPAKESADSQVDSLPEPLAEPLALPLIMPLVIPLSDAQGAAKLDTQADAQGHAQADSQAIQRQAHAQGLANQELSFALTQIESQEHLVTNNLLADLLFLQGRNLHQQGDLEKARSYYEASLAHWEQQSLTQLPDAANITPDHPDQPLTDPALPSFQDKQATLLFHLALWWRTHAVLHPHDYGPACEQAQQYFVRCLTIFRQQNRLDRLGRFMLALAEVLHKLENWPALAAIAQEGTILHQGDPIRLARDYGYLAEVALAHYADDPHPEYLSESQRFAQQALEISEQAAVQLGESASSAIAPVARRRDRSQQTALRYQQGRYLYLLARAQQLQGQITEALASLEKARAHTDPRYDLALYRHILNRLWHLYFAHKHYAQAFEIKLAQRRVESLFGLRAFIGAGQIQPAQSLGAANRRSLPAEVAAEIRISGREQDIKTLTDRLCQPRYPIVVIHGPSGVGKSSTLSAGLMPKLHQMISEGRTTYPMLISSYSHWAEQVEAFINLDSSPDSGREPTENNAPARLFSPSYLINRLKLLTQQRYQQVVLIFDQFEDFFYQHPTVEQRRELYVFLRDCLELPYVKVVLSLREDFLHYLLEWDRNADLSIIENDILGKEIRYYLGNFLPKAAESVIRQLTQGAGFYLEEGLITALVDDLAADTGEIRPIELQVVGAQLQREGITTLEQYQLLGLEPKAQLLKNFLDNVIHDCGPENKRLAQAVLYLLSDGTSRPLKSYSEIEEALTVANISNEPEQLQLVLSILVGSGLIFEILEVSGERYQLVHEYLAGLMQQQPPSGIVETGLLEALQTERSRRQQSEHQLKAALAAQSDSLEKTTLAYQRAQSAEIRALVSVARSLRLSGNGLGALTKAIRAAKQLYESDRHSDPLLKLQTALCLDTCLREIREKNELSGHSNWVLAVDGYPLAGRSPQQPYLASASDDGTIKLWNSQGTCLKTLTGHQAGVVDVRFSPDGRYLASASLDHSIRLWQANGEFIRSLEVASASVTSVSFSPVAHLLAATYSDAQVRLWNFAGDLVKTLEGHEDWARTVTFSPDGQLLATGGEDQTVRLWRVTGEPLQVLRGHQGWVRSVAFSPNGQTLLCAGDTNTLRLWSLDGRKLKTLYGHEDWVRSIAFSPDGQRIASGSDDQTVKIWGIEGTIQQTFNQRSSVHSVAWSADGQSVISGGDDDQVHIWRLQGPPEAICRAHTGIVWSARWRPGVSSPRFLSAGGDNTIKLWSDGKAFQGNRAELLQSISGHKRGVHSVAWSPEGDFFASASADYSVRIWTAEGTFVRSLTGHTASVWQISYSPDGQRLASVSSDRTLRLWSPKGKLLKTWDDHSNTVWHVSFSPDSQHLITASEDNSLRLWNVKKGLIQTLQGHEGGVWCARFSPNGKQLASGGADGVIRLWSVTWQGQQQIRIEPKPLLLKGHRDWVRSLSFSPEGDFLASASDDGTVRLWSLLPEALESLSSAVPSSIDSAQLLPAMTGHEGVIWEVDFDSTGERLVTASADGTVRIWDLRLNVLIQKGCDWLEDWLLTRPEAKKQLCSPAVSLSSPKVS